MDRRSFLGTLLGSVPGIIVAGGEYGGSSTSRSINSSSTRSSGDYDWPSIYPWPEIKKPEVPKGAAADGRPEMKFFTSLSCGPCRAAKEKLTEKVLKGFPFRLIEIDNDIHKGWDKEVPAFVWEVGNKTHWYIGFPGVEQLVAGWKGTQPGTKMVVRNNYPAMYGYRPRWTWPGNLAYHLRMAHGVGESLTQDQMEAVHDALHEGYSLQQIRNRVR